MPTTNPTIAGPGWTFLVADGDEFLLTLPHACQTLYVATGGGHTSSDSSSSETASDWALDEPPTDLLGHALAAGRDSMNRALIGPGPVFARCVDHQAIVTIALNAWTP